MDKRGEWNRGRSGIADEVWNGFLFYYLDDITLLGITMTNALVKSAKAKNIERFYGTLKNQFSREFTGFCAHLAIKKSSAMAYLRIFTARSCGIIALKKR